MTKLTRSVIRETAATLHAQGSRPVVIELHPKTIVLRLKGRRDRYSFPIDRLYTLAVHAHVESRLTRSRRHGR